MKNTKYNNKGIKVMMEFNYIPRPIFLSENIEKTQNAENNEIYQQVINNVSMNMIQ